MCVVALDAGRLPIDWASQTELGGGEGTPLSDDQLRGGMRLITEALSMSLVDTLAGMLAPDATRCGKVAEKRLLGSMSTSIGVPGWPIAPAGALPPRTISDDTFRIV